MTDQLLPLERWFNVQSSNKEYFPHGSEYYFDRYKSIKNYLAKEVYPLIGAATSAAEQGIYTDHGPDHFDAVIRYAGKLLDLPTNPDGGCDLFISPYEVFVLLVSILLHDAGNIYGRAGHEKRAITIFRDMGSALCPDAIEAKVIADIATAHGGKTKIADGNYSKDNIGITLGEKTPYGGCQIRQQLIAAIVRFADEICEEKNRAARFLLERDLVPKHSEVFHAYANGISSVDVDLKGKCVNIRFELMKEHMVKTYGKGSIDCIQNVFLIDEIFSRLEKMNREMLYCQRFMSEHIGLNCIRAKVIIYDGANMDIVLENAFELREVGYPEPKNSLATEHPTWIGSNLSHTLESRPTS